MIHKLTFFISLLFIANPLLVEAKRKSKKGKVVEINFDDELLIKGKLLGPSLFTLYQKRNVEFGKLIKPRKNFLPEMRATLGDVK
ncbi:MAG: hypothetical protein OXN83_00595 [Oligoflexia bacterium]|nr:hypothetical protein [Oligoflexia bacterium]